MYVDFNYRVNKNFLSHRTLLRKTCPQVNYQVYPKTPPPLNFPQVKPQVLKQNFRFFKRTKVQQLYHDDCHPSLSEMKYFEMK